jgi:hypothetical protein
MKNTLFIDFHYRKPTDKQFEALRVLAEALGTLFWVATESKYRVTFLDGQSELATKTAEMLLHPKSVLAS